MRVERIRIKNYKCFSGERVFEFPENYTCMVGPNGSGKTTLLTLIARLAGTDDAVKLGNSGYGDEQIGLIDLELSHAGKPYRLILKDFDLDAIYEFKESLPTRVSFPFGPDWLMSTQTVHDICPDRIGPSMQTVRRIFGPTRSQYVMKGRRYGLEHPLAQTSAYYWMLRLSRRLSSVRTPMIFDDMPGNLDYGKRSEMRAFLTGGVAPGQQIIFSTHCPRVLAGCQNSEIISV